MSGWKIYSKENRLKCEAFQLTYSGEHMGACSVSVNIASSFPITFELGDYLSYRGDVFELNYDPTVIKQSSVDTCGEGFLYENIVFNSPSDELTRCAFLDYVPKDNGYVYSAMPTFSFIADSVKKLAERIQANLDRVYSDDRKWTVVVPEDTQSKLNINVTASNNNVWEALGFVNSLFASSFIIRGREISIGISGKRVSHDFSYGEKNGLCKIEKSANSDQQVITRLRAYGSTRNMPSDYYTRIGAGVPNNMAVKNLMLPSFPDESIDPFIDSANIGEYGVREGTVVFDGSNGLEEIYPSMEGMTAEKLKEAGINVDAEGALDVVLGAEVPKDNGREYPKDENQEDSEGGEESEEEEEKPLKPDFKIRLKDIGFDINDYLSSEGAAAISMKNGMCGGRDFEIVECKAAGGGYELTCNRVYDEGIDLYFPNSDYPVRANDKFVLLNIEMPDVYVKEASMRLWYAAVEYLSRNDEVYYNYNLTVDDNFMARQHDHAIRNYGTSIHDTIREGDLITFMDEDLGIEKTLPIGSLSIKEDKDSLIPRYEITLQEKKTVGTITKIQNQLSSLSVNGIGSVSEEQVESLMKMVGSRLYLSKTRSDRSKGTIASDKGFEVGKFTEGTLGSGASIYKDETYATHIEADYLKIRRKAIFTTITVQELKHVGGEIVLSPAAMVCSKVEELETGYKCYFNKKDAEGREIYNDFKAGDFARCQVFNLIEGSKFYWRHVDEADADYIVLSKTYRVGEDIPAEGDNIVQLGNEDDVERQSAIVISAYGSDAPSYKQYNGIDRMELSADMLVTRLSPSGNMIKGDFVTTSGKNVSEELENIKVDWDKVLDQTDKEFTMWFFDHTPSADRAPESDWTTHELKELHEQDLFYCTDENSEFYGHAWRYVFKDGKYYWEEVTDAATIAALESAFKANQRLDNIANDGILSTSEQKALRKEWRRITSAYGSNIILAKAYGVENTSIVSSYRLALEALGTYLNNDIEWTVDKDIETLPSWIAESNTNDIVIVAFEYKEKWQNFYNAEKALSDKLSELVNNKADEALDKLSIIASDGWLSASEKKSVLKEWTTAVVDSEQHKRTAEYLGLIKDGVVKDEIYQSYVDSLNSLGTYLNGGNKWNGGTPVWIGRDFSKDTKISSSEFIGKWSDYSDSETALLNHFSTLANNNAEKALGWIGRIVSDGTISALEKKEILKEWTLVVTSKSLYEGQAELFEVDVKTDEVYISYINALNALGTFMNGGSEWHIGISTIPLWLSSDDEYGLKTDTTDVDAGAYVESWDRYYEAELALLNYFTELSKERADKVQEELNEIVSDGVLSALEKKEVLKEWKSIVSSKARNVATAKLFSIDSQTHKRTYDEYLQAYDNLGTMMNGGEEWDGTSTPKWLDEDLGKNTQLKGEGFAIPYVETWSAYYTAEYNLLAMFSELANEKSEEALGWINNVIMDGVLSALEKKEVLKEWAVIHSNYTTYIDKAKNYGIPYSAYESAFVNLSTYMNGNIAWTSGIPSWLSSEEIRVDTTLIRLDGDDSAGDSYRRLWMEYYEEEEKIKDAVSKAYSDNSTRVFTSTPKAPYNVGDRWKSAVYPSDGSFYDGIDLVCVAARLKGESFNIEDWSPSEGMTASTIKTTSDSVKIVTEVFEVDSNGKIAVKSSSGIVTTANMSSMFAQYVDPNGEIVKKADIQAFVSKSPDGTLESGVKITADNVDINNGVVVIDSTSAKIGGFTIWADSITGGNKYKMSLTPDNDNGYPSIKWERFDTTYAEIGVVITDGNLDEGNIFLRSYRGDKLSLSPSHFEFLLDELDGTILNSSFGFFMDAIGNSKMSFTKTYDGSEKMFEMGIDLGVFRMKSNSWLEAEGLAKTGEVYVKDGYLMVKK